MLHCRCSKCYSVPTKKRVRKRVPPALGLLSLPEEVLLCILQCLSAEDLLSVRAVSECTITLLPSQFFNMFIYCGADKLCPVAWMLSDVHQLSCFLLQAHSQLRDIVDNHSSVWARVSFRDLWPSPNSLWLFERYRHDWQSAEKPKFTCTLLSFWMGDLLKNFYISGLLKRAILKLLWS